MGQGRLRAHFWFFHMGTESWAQTFNTNMQDLKVKAWRMGRNPRNPSCGEDHPVQLQIITSLGMAGLAQDGQGKALCATASSAQMHLAFTGFFPSVSTEQVNFGKAGAVLLGVVFPLGVYMSVHPISSSPDLHLAGREAGRAKGCEH